MAKTIKRQQLPPAQGVGLRRIFAGGFVELLQSAVQNCSNSGVQPAFRVFTYDGTNAGESPTFQEKFEPEPNVVFTG